MQQSSSYRWCCARFEWEYELEEIVRGLLGYDLSPDLRQQLIAETKKAGRNMWYLLSEENRGNIPRPEEFWRLYCRGEDIEAYMPASKGKRDRLANIQYALWGGVLDVLDATGLIYTYGRIYTFEKVFNALKEIAARLGLQVEEFVVQADKSPTGEEMRSLRLSIPASAPAPQPSPQPSTPEL